MTFWTVHKKGHVSESDIQLSFEHSLGEPVCGWRLCCVQQPEVTHYSAYNTFLASTQVWRSISLCVCVCVNMHAESVNCCVIHSNMMKYFLRWNLKLENLSLKWCNTRSYVFLRMVFELLESERVSLYLIWRSIRVCSIVNFLDNENVIIW